MPTTGDATKLDYVRLPIPETTLSTPAGAVISLRTLARDRAVLLLHVPRPSPARAETLRRVEGWAAKLSRVALVPVLADSVRGVDLAAPTALLLGADGLLAGGPVEGFDAIDDFVSEIGEAVDDPAGTNQVRSPTPSLREASYARVSFGPASAGLRRPGLVIVTITPARLHLEHPDVRIINLDFTFRTIGEKENFAVSACRFDTIAGGGDTALPNHPANIDRYPIGMIYRIGNEEPPA